jgi:hypothetical protein
VKTKRLFAASKWLSVWAAVFLLSNSSSAQETGNKGFVEFSLSYGSLNFIGDLGGNVGRGTTFIKDNNIASAKPMVGLNLTYYPSQWLGVRLSANSGRVAGDDALIIGKGGPEEDRKQRNLNFRSPLKEVLLMAEIYPTAFFYFKNNNFAQKFLPYGILGVGLFHFNPQGQDLTTGQWYDLKPLHTEGQGFTEYPTRKEYKLTQMNMPMGFGFRYFITDRLSTSLEILLRTTRTDYIDDVSTTYIDPTLFDKYLDPVQADLAQRMAFKGDPLGLGSTTASAGAQRGTPVNNDAYFSFGIKVSYRLGNILFDREPHAKSSTKCPKRL